MSAPATGLISSRLLPLLHQLRQVAGEKDRDRINRYILDTLATLYGIEDGAIYLYFLHGNQHWLALNATLTHRHGEQEISSIDPYQLNVHARQELEGLPHLQTPLQAGQRYLEEGAHWQLLVYPLLHNETPYALIELQRASPFASDELEELDQFIGILQDHLNLVRYAETDTLTGMLNRKTFDENLDRVLASVHEYEPEPAPEDGEQRHLPPEPGMIWLAVMDIDHFKQINDNFGHIIGDEVLILLAQLMRDSFRLHDQLFRFGGEEFVAVIRTGSAEDTARVLERFRERIAEHAFPLVGQVTISIGYTLVDPMDTPTELVARADSALYYAKQNGRNLVARYEELRDAGLIGGGQAKATEIELF